jgi:hypothetical protein
MRVKAARLALSSLPLGMVAASPPGYLGRGSLGSRGISLDHPVPISPITNSLPSHQTDSLIRCPFLALKAYCHAQRNSYRLTLALCEPRLEGELNNVVIIHLFWCTRLSISLGYRCSSALATQELNLPNRDIVTLTCLTVPSLVGPGG